METPDLSKNYPLQHEWTLWVGKQHKGGNWSDSMVHLCDFKTVQEFAQYWNHVPRPSQCFGGGKAIESVQLFKKGIRPEWEDVANANGGEWTVRKPFDLRSGELDALWENLVMGLVGEQIDGGDEICGARVVDKSRGRQSIFRLEMWYRDSSKEDVNNTLRDKMIECLNHGDPGKAASNLAFEKVVHNDKKW